MCINGFKAIQHHLALMWKEWNFHSCPLNIFLVTCDFQCLRHRQFERIPGRLNLHVPHQLPSEKRDIKIHNGPLIGAHMFSQRASVTKRPGLVWSMKQVLQETYWQSLWSNQIPPRVTSSHSEGWRRVYFVRTCAQKASCSVRTGFVDQGNLQHCWVL